MNSSERASKLEELATLCRETGFFIAAQRRKVQSEQIEDKALNSLVSYVDKEAERMLEKV
jgi:myo-inositol-1(or 4)-monophosphatase